MLGFVSLFMDLSSELVHSLLPVFLVSTLGASVLTIGLIEVTTEASALVAKVSSGGFVDAVSILTNQSNETLNGKLAI